MRSTSMGNFKVETSHPIATESLDTMFPGGTMHDSSVNLNFNRIIYELFPKKPLFVMDLGCAGGGMVRTFLDDGHVALGLEGSDYSTLWDGPGGTEAERARRKPGKRAEWANIPDHLFTADITRPFKIYWDNSPAKFDVITAWEVMEHIPEEGLPQLAKNVHNHLAGGGLWVVSVSTQQGFHHVTVKPREWWLKRMGELGFSHREGVHARFTLDDWVRGPRQNAPDSFHLCLGCV